MGSLLNLILQPIAYYAAHFCSVGLLPRPVHRLQGHHHAAAQEETESRAHVESASERLANTLRRVAVACWCAGCRRRGDGNLAGVHRHQPTSTSRADHERAPTACNHAPGQIICSCSYAFIRRDRGGDKQRRLGRPSNSRRFPGGTQGCR
jgi:hypothetical protein